MDYRKEKSFLQNDAAEKIMRRVEEEEKEIEDGEETQLHLCIINLVIGTLYCSKGNHDFGISRVIKSFDPLERNLDQHTWHYAKKCFISVLHAMSKNMVFLSDDRMIQIEEFLVSVIDKETDMSAEAKKLLETFRSF